MSDVVSSEGLDIIFPPGPDTHNVWLDKPVEGRITPRRFMTSPRWGPDLGQHVSDGRITFVQVRGRRKRS